MSSRDPDGEVDPSRPLGDRIVACLSWTLAIAIWRKGDLKGAARTRIIVQMNRSYLCMSLALLVATIAASTNDLARTQWSHDYPGAAVTVLTLLLASYCLSRCIEVFYAFYRDAFAKLGRIPSDSDLGGRQRIALALASYVELIADFAFLQSLVPTDAWQCLNANSPKAVTDVLFYSASTITTSGGGGFVPKGYVPQALTAFEIACGLILLVVCFAVYANDAFADPPKVATAPENAAQPVVGLEDGDVEK